jgi:hypothetical protein
MTRVAWAPDGMLAPLDLIAVMIKPGVITERDWLEAMAFI